MILAKDTNVREAQAVDGSLPAVMCSEKLIKYFMTKSFCSAFVNSLKPVSLDNFNIQQAVCVQ